MLDTILTLQPSDYQGLIWLLVLGFIVMMVPVFKVVRDVLISKLKQMIADNHVEKTQVVLTCMNEINSNTIKILEQIYNRIDAIDKPGVKGNEQETLREYYASIDKYHNRIMAFFLKRVHINHIDTEEKVIYNRYKRFAGSLAGDTTGYLAYYMYEGRKLSDFFSGGALLYYEAVLTELFNIQVQQYKDHKEINVDDIQAALDRNLSVLISHIKRWLHGGDNLAIAWDNIKTQLLIGEVEKLGEIEEI